MKVLLRFTCLMLMMVISLFSAFSVNAVDIVAPVDEEIIDEYAYTVSVSANLSINSNTATCRSTVYANSYVTKIALTQYLQKKVNGSWTNIKTWSKTVNTYVISYTNTKSSLSSGTYRTRTVAKVYKNSSYETVSSNSSTVQI